MQILSNENFANALSIAVVFAEQTLAKTGFAACYLLSGDARQAKRILCALEDESPLGRLRRAAVEALEREAYITLKPGLVDETAAPSGYEPCHAANPIWRSLPPPIPSERNCTGANLSLEYATKRYRPLPSVWKG